jgi:hypothetical protein
VAWKFISPRQEGGNKIDVSQIEVEGVGWIPFEKLPDLVNTAIHLQLL